MMTIMMTTKIVMPAKRPAYLVKNKSYGVGLCFVNRFSSSFRGDVVELCSDESSANCIVQRHLLSSRRA